MIISAGAMRMPQMREVQRVCRLAQADSFVQEFPDKYDTMIVEGGNNVFRRPEAKIVYCQGVTEKNLKS